MKQDLVKEKGISPGACDTVLHLNVVRYFTPGLLVVKSTQPVSVGHID